MAHSLVFLVGGEQTARSLKEGLGLHVLKLLILLQVCLQLSGIPRPRRRLPPSSLRLRLLGDFSVLLVNSRRRLVVKTPSGVCLWNTGLCSNWRALQVNAMLSCFILALDLGKVSK